MAKITNPKTLSDQFDIDRRRLDDLGVLDQTLAIDTKLFIDPLLLSSSEHPEMSYAAVDQYRHHFEQVIKFLVLTEKQEDVAWRSARRMLEFHEIPGTCLGYGAATIRGSGFGYGLTQRILHLGKEIVDLGVRDPDLFSAMALFEEDIGPDRISDMTTNVIRSALVEFNRRVLAELGLEGEEFETDGLSGMLLANPMQKRRVPILLVPKDVLRKLPIALDWDDVSDAASKNAALRKNVNEQIGHIWANKTRRDKSVLRSQVMVNNESFQTLLNIIHEVTPKPYDADSDPDGLINWSHIAKGYADHYPLDLTAVKHLRDLDSVHRLVLEIVEQFKTLVETNGLNKELYKEDGKPKPESTAQRLFFAIAHSYCAANNVDISPEVDSGSGQVDFKFSKGFDARVLVELKLSTNSKLVHGYETQLEVYKLAEQTMRAVYLVIDVGKMGKKYELLISMRNQASERRDPLSDLYLVNGKVLPSASIR